MKETNDTLPAQVEENFLLLGVKAAGIAGIAGGFIYGFIEYSEITMWIAIASFMIPVIIAQSRYNLGETVLTYGSIAVLAGLVSVGFMYFPFITACAAMSLPLALIVWGAYALTGQATRWWNR